jgi:hypothetical protein
MKEPAKAALIAGGGLGLLAALVWGFTRNKNSESSGKHENADVTPPDGVAALPQSTTITRTSCLECVEKHLGAALVLSAEERDGYPYRLRVIGHLHEAEDESQAWPALHTAIREARKRYQHTGQAPNFDALAQIADSISR